MKNTIKTMRQFGKMTETRFSHEGTKLYIQNQAPGLWRYVVCEGGECATVGPQFKTKTEAFSEIKEYANEYFGGIFA